MFNIVIRLADNLEGKTLSRMRTAALPRIGDEVQLPDEEDGGIVYIERVRHFASMARSMDIRNMTASDTVLLEGRLIPLGSGTR